MSDQPSSSVGHAPSGQKWQFDESVTRCFDDMLMRSIPGYSEMRRATFQIGREILGSGLDTRVVVDLGCSRGGALAEFVAEYGDRCRYVGCEVSPPMLAAAKERFAAKIAAGVVHIENHDLRKGFPRCEPLADLTLCVLTLQFLPIEHRWRLLREAADATPSGGGLILVEKVLGETADSDRLLVDTYLRTKAEHGYSQQDIDLKRASLEGVLVPVTESMNRQFLRHAGFDDVECFWRQLNFAGWIARKR